MQRLIIDGNKVYTVDEACLRRKNMTVAQVREAEASRGKRQEIDPDKRK